jgi:hypothetical protein
MYMNTSTSKLILFTATDVSRLPLCKHPPASVKQISEALSIEPIRTVGGIRLFTQEQTDLIVAESVRRFQERLHRHEPPE